MCLGLSSVSGLMGSHPPHEAQRGLGSPLGSLGGCLHPASGISDHPCPPSTPSCATVGTLLTITPASYPIGRGSWSSQA